MKNREEAGWIAADEADLRRRLAAIAETTEVDDEAWEKIQGRIATARAKPAPSRRPVAVAAAAAVVALVLGVLTIVQRDGDPSVVDAVDDDATTTTASERQRSRGADDDSTSTTETRSGAASPEDVLRPPASDTGGSGSAPADPDPGGDDDVPRPGPTPNPGGMPPPTSPGPTAPPSTSVPGGDGAEMSLSPTVVTQGESVTISSVTPCIDEAWNEMVAVSIVHSGAEVGWRLIAPDGAGGWSWTFATTTNNPPGAYTVSAQCGYTDPQNPDHVSSWYYDDMVFMVQTA